MRPIELLKLQSELAYKQLLGSIDGVSEQQSWAKIECVPGQYMHSEGSILSTVVHVAACKFLYGSAGYRDLEIRWRDAIDRIEGFWPNWDGAKSYLAESQAYWLDSWANEEDLERLVATPTDRTMPSWKALWTVTDHDGYHAGQIEMLHSTLLPSETPPPDEIHLWHKFCSPLASY